MTSQNHLSGRARCIRAAVVIGIGGIACAEDVIEMMSAGATAVEIGAENLRNPYVCKEIIERLPSLMDELKIEKLSDIIGRAHQ